MILTVEAMYDLLDEMIESDKKYLNYTISVQTDSKSQNESYICEIDKILIKESDNSIILLIPELEEIYNYISKYKTKN